MKLPSVKDAGPAHRPSIDAPQHRRSHFPVDAPSATAKSRLSSPKSRLSSAKSRGSTPKKGEGKARKAKNIRFHPCSPGQVLQMCKLLGVDPSVEFYLLPIVKRAVMAPFPEDWAVGHDQMGEVYYYNKFSMKVISVHPMSEYFLDAIDDARKRDKEERELAEAKGDEILVDDSAFWMRFGTLNSDECYYYNFDTNLLHSEAQYKHVIELQLEDRRKQVQKEKEQGGKDASAVKKMQEELASKRALQSMFARGVKKMFIQWVMYVMEMRLQQTKALQKLGSIAGQNEASSFRQWKQRNEELVKVRRAMAPFAGRKDKMLVRDMFRDWRQEVQDAVQERKELEMLEEAFKAWKQSCVKSLHMKKAKEILSFLVKGGSASANFCAWRDVIWEKKDKEVEILEGHCLKLQRRFRERQKLREEERARANVRKQLKYQLLRVGESIAPAVSRYASLFQGSPDFEMPEPKKPLPADTPSFTRQPTSASGATGGVGAASRAASSATAMAAADGQDEPEDEKPSLALMMLKGAIENTGDDLERARLRGVVRIAKAKASILPGERGFGTSSVRDDVTRVVDVLAPVDGVRLRVALEGLEAETLRSKAREGEDFYRENQVMVSWLKKASGAVENLVEKVVKRSMAKGSVQPAQELASLTAEAGNVHTVALRARKFIDAKLATKLKHGVEGKQELSDHVDDATVLDDLDAAMEKLLTEMEKQRAESQEW